MALEELAACDRCIKDEYHDYFPVDIPHCDSLPDNVLFHVQPKDASKVIQLHLYNCPQKYKAAWHTLLQQHITTGRLHASNSEHSSPAFIILKADPMVLPWWVNDYRILNSNTIPDNHPLPWIDEILCDCAKGQFFGKIDMTVVRIGSMW